MGKVLTNKRIKELNPDYDYSKIPPQYAGENRCQITYVFLALNPNKLTLVEGHGLEGNQLVPEDLVRKVLIYSYTLEYNSGSLSLKSTSGTGTLRVKSYCVMPDGSVVGLPIHASTSASWFNIDTIGDTEDATIKYIYYTYKSNPNFDARGAYINITQDSAGGGNPKTFRVEMVQKGSELPVGGDIIKLLFDSHISYNMSISIEYAGGMTETEELPNGSHHEFNNDKLRGDQSGTIRLGKANQGEGLRFYVKDENGHTLNIGYTDYSYSGELNVINFVHAEGDVDITYIRNHLDSYAGRYIGDFTIAVPNYPKISLRVLI